MPSSTRGLEMLVLPRSLGGVEWNELTERRRELIKPLLDRITIPKLRDIYQIGWNQPEVLSDEGLSLDTQGIYGLQPWKERIRIPNSGHQPPRGWGATPDGSRKYWGLTRGNQWVVVTVSFKGEAHHNDPKYPYGKGYEKIYLVEIRHVDLPTLLAETRIEAHEVWRQLGREIKRWEESRLHQYNWAHTLADQVRNEELVLSLVLGH